MRVKPGELSELTRPVLAPRARLVQLLASLAYDGDLEAAWWLVRERMQLTERERRDVVEQLGLTDSKENDG